MYLWLVTHVKQRIYKKGGKLQMKREFLKEFGLTDEQIDKIMAENGGDIQREQEKLNEKVKELEIVSGQLTEANKTIKSYKDMDIDKIKQSSAEWEEKYNKAMGDLKTERESNLLDKLLLSVNTHDADVVKGLLKKEELVFKDDNVLGLDKQIETLKKDKPYLFKEEEGAKKTPTFTSSAKTGAAKSGISKEQFANMSYFERLELKQSDEAQYNELVKGE